MIRSESEDEFELNRRLAVFQREIAISTKKIVMDEISHAARWIMASVLAINSGGLIAAVNTTEQMSIVGFCAIAAFYIGVTLALMMGWKLIKMNQAMLPIHSEFISIWEMTAVDGILEKEKLDQVAEKLFVFASKEIGLPHMFSRLSFLSFSVGLIFLALASS